MQMAESANTWQNTWQGLFEICAIDGVLQYYYDGHHTDLGMRRMRSAGHAPPGVRAGW
jgi:hypothetical protein